MTDSLTGTAIPTPVVAEWTSPFVDISRIQRELMQLWIEWELTHRVPSDDDQEKPSAQLLMRPSTVNLVATADTLPLAARIEELITQSPDFGPSRGLILVREALPEGATDYAIRLAVQERYSARNRNPIRMETVMIGAAPGNDDILASVTSPLLVADLPDVLLVRDGQLTTNTLATSLLDIVDGLVVDTGSLSDPGESLSYLSQFSAQPAHIPLADLVWHRLAIWRQLIAQFFDQPAHLSCLDAIDEVRIVCAQNLDEDRSSLTAGLLTAGWLASQLGWRAPGELIRARDGWRLTLRAGERGRSREVLLRVLEGSAPFSCRSLEAVHLLAGGEVPGTFSVVRTDEDGITTTSESVGGPAVSRLVHMGCPDDRWLLSDILRMLREDPIHIDALRFAALLWPEEMTR